MFRSPLHIVMLSAVFLAGCQQEMAEQPAYRPLEASAFFPDERSARPLPPGTVPRGPLQVNQALHTGRAESTPGAADDPADMVKEYVKVVPFPLTTEVLHRGQERYEIFCAVCHGLDGKGDGKIVERGYTRPPNYVTDLSRGFEHRGVRIPLREVPIGYIFEVITKGYGAMPDYESQVPPSDRWAIAAYVRALQISQHLSLSDLPNDVGAEIRIRLEKPEALAPGKAQPGEPEALAPGGSR
jgi:mono/diheme cytochrome c family protein